MNPKDHPDAKIGDVVEIYLPEDDGVRLLLQITSFQEDKKGTKGMANSKQSMSTVLAALFFNQSNSRTDVISIDASIASAFNLPTYSEVVMRTIDPATVALDSVEITFKDQYMGRSEMWRLKTYLVNTYMIFFCCD